jgi:hydrogenase expression/formation protein HypE
MNHLHITLAHGNGGRLMRDLIDDCFARHLANPHLDTRLDGTPLTLDEREIVITTDGFTVNPIEFPGGNIGSLAIHGTVNDLAVSGAEPRYLTLNAFLEEGLEIALLERILAAMASAAREAGVSIVAGDTKVLPHGQVSGIYLATTGIGLRASRQLAIDSIQSGDRILVSGPVGDHGTAVMLAREQFGLRGDLHSDAASILPLCRALWSHPGVRFMRDPTRGGLAAVAHEIARSSRLGVTLDGAAIPIRDPVNAICEMLGYDPLYLACEGRVVAVVAADAAASALHALHQAGAGDAAIIGTLGSGANHVILKTPLGGERLIDELEDEPLPRIC